MATFLNYFLIGFVIGVLCALLIARFGRWVLPADKDLGRLPHTEERRRMLVREEMRRHL